MAAPTSLGTLLYTPLEGIHQPNWQLTTRAPSCTSACTTRGLGFMEGVWSLFSLAQAPPPACCSCWPANPPPPAPPRKCAAHYGTKLGGRPCCGQDGMISDQEHVCLSFEPKCYGYSRGVAFGECVSADEESRRKRNDNFDEGDLTDRCAHATASLAWSTDSACCPVAAVTTRPRGTMTMESRWTMHVGPRVGTHH